MKNKGWILVFCCILGILLAAMLITLRQNAGSAGSTTGAAPANLGISHPSVKAVTQPKKGTAPPNNSDILLKQTAELKMSDAVKTVMGLNPDKKDYNARSKVMREPTRRLSADDVKALMLFLDSKVNTQKDMKPLEFNGIKNDVLDILLRQDKIPDGLGKQVVTMYHDSGHDDVWRDYCVQYMSACYESIKPTGIVTNESDMTRTNIANAYWEAVEQKDKTIAGTSLIALEQLSRTHPEFDRTKVGETALALASDERCGEAARITALRICGMMGKTNVLSSVRVTVQTGETVPLRMAAVATLGDLGEKEDMELVKSLTASSEKRISNVASSAVSRLTKKLESKEGK